MSFVPNIQNEVPDPLETGFTVYSKTKCPYCDKAKKLLESGSEVYEIIDCDSYLSTPKRREQFLEIMEEIVGFKYTTFPMIFLNGRFLGGYRELEKRCVNILEENIFG